MKTSYKASLMCSGFVMESKWTFRRDDEIIFTNGRFWKYSKDGIIEYSEYYLSTLVDTLIKKGVVKAIPVRKGITWFMELNNGLQITPRKWEISKKKITVENMNGEWKITFRCNTKSVIDNLKKLGLKE